MAKFVHSSSVSRKDAVSDQAADAQRCHTIYQINRLPEEEKQTIYVGLIPPQIFTRFRIDPETLRNEEGKAVFQCSCRAKTCSVRIELRYRAADDDPLFLLEMRDTPFGDVEILFLNMTNPKSERFYIDRDAEGNDTVFATMSRNLPEEVRAMQAGLAPGQTRKGLRLFRSFWTQARMFGQTFGIKQVKVEPLAYHNAIMHEFYGFRYITGREMMEWIDREFAPGGELFQRLDGSTPFRHPSFARSIKGRSWAIHDGVLPEPWQCPRMYYSIEESPDRIFDPFTCRRISSRSSGLLT
jgi:hypothetical protein